MGDLTQNAVDGLLGLLTSVVKDEVRLQRGVQGDIQFIKDEMDSMNGFLMHLTKTKTEHNDQHRAWMKQVCDISYVAQDCIELYLRDLSPPEGGIRSFIRHLPVLLCTYCKRRDLAKQLHELKDRVREVGERRQRYGVSVPEKVDFKPELAGKDINADKREKFLQALKKYPWASPPSLSEAISLLPRDLPSLERTVIDEILKKCVDVDSKKMFLCALYAYPHVTGKELETNLKKKLIGARDVDAASKEVMLFSYSKLSRHYKSCLQYLTAFRKETSISRTSMVRRWVAEGFVARDNEDETMEEAGELCFDELVFRGFVHPAPHAVPGQKIKSCCVKESVWEFIFGMAKSENFVASLPTHLGHQLRIREVAQRELTKEQQLKQRPCPSWNMCPRKQKQLDDDDNTAAENKQPHPMDEMVQLLKNLPEEYRLNVLDLGGCSALKDSHLKGIISKVPWLKYLSIRNTDVSRLPKEINNFRRLETLDIRQTKIKDGGTKHIVLVRLKHLLAGHISMGKEAESLITVQMPHKIGNTVEVLRYVQILKGKAELDPLENLKQLRKLGVVIEGSKDNLTYFNQRTIHRLSKHLRSLSLWINEPNSKDNNAAGDGNVYMDGKTPVVSSPPQNLESLNIKGKISRQVGLPQWINQLNLLSKITLRNTELSNLQTIGDLKSLCCLRLRRGSYIEDSITLEIGKFQKLRFLLISHTTIKRISFQENAAPKLEKIVWTLMNNETVIGEDTISGINNLISLEELELSGNWSDKGRRHVEKQLGEHPKFPHLLPYSSIFHDTHAHEVPIIGV